MNGLSSSLRKQNSLAQTNGFQKDINTEMAQLKFNDYVTKSVSSGRKTADLLLDISRCFDCVDHDKLLECLEKDGCPRASERMVSKLPLGQLGELKQLKLNATPYICCALFLRVQTSDLPSIWSIPTLFVTFCNFSDLLLLLPTTYAQSIMKKRGMGLRGA